MNDGASYSLGPRAKRKEKIDSNADWNRRRGMGGMVPSWMPAAVDQPYPARSADDRFDTPLRKKGPGSETQEKQPATILERFKLFSVWPNSIRVGDRRYQGFEVPLHTKRLGLPASKQCEGIHGLKYRHSPAAHGLATKCPRRT